MKAAHRVVTALAAAAMLLLSGAALAQDEGGYDNSRTYAGPNVGLPASWGAKLTEWSAIAAPLLPDVPPNTVTEEVLTANAKLIAMQAMMMSNPLSLRQMITMMVAKKKVVEDLTFDEVLESMDLRANLLNMKKVGHNTPSKVIEATTGEPSPRLEMISYCDIPTMRTILDYVPEFSVFVPCRITVMEDANGDIWIMTLDWDIRWMDTSPNPNKITPELREAAIYVRESIESIMEAGANGDL